MSLQIMQDVPSGSRSVTASRDKDAYEAFESMCQMISAYRDEIDYRDVYNDEDVIRKFVAATECPGSFFEYRATINHFLKFMMCREINILDIDERVIALFRNHVCTRACWPARALQSRYQNVALSRFHLFLQYQGILESRGWSSSDPDVLIRFRDRLVAEGVHRLTADVQAKIAFHFVLWMRLAGIDRSRIDDMIVQKFADHKCNCGFNMKFRVLNEKEASRRRIAVDRFQRFLAGKNPVFRNGIFIQRRKRSLPSEAVLRYCAWLSDQRGLRPQTVRIYMHDVMSWLPVLGEDATAYTANSIRQLAVAEFAKRSPPMQSRFIRSVRSYIAFQAAEGKCCSSLAHSLISRPSYSLSSVPRRLDADAVKRVIANCDLSTPRGIRDRAVLTLLAELGLRGGEVWKLKLEDFNWVEARISIEGKGGRAAAVPLTQNVGDSVLDYLESVRPISPSDRVFLRMSRPYSPFASASEITNIAVFNLARCGLAGGSHVFRHTLATELLRDGRSLEDVATVLRHQSLNTTTIYAKVNEPMLKRLAEPWMEGSS